MAVAKKQGTPVPDAAAAAAVESELPEGWQTRHPRLTYADETAADHARRLRALAEGVPARRERLLAAADELERGAA